MDNFCEANAHFQSIADFDGILQIAPEHPEAYYYRASAKFELGKSQQGQGEIEQGVNQGLGQNTLAEADFQKAQELNPDVGELYLLGIRTRRKY